MLVTLSTFNDYDFILRSSIRFDLMSSLHDLMLYAIRALGDVIIVYSEMSWTGYAHFHRRKCKPSLYSPFPGVGGLLVRWTILTPGRRSAYAHSVHCNLHRFPEIPRKWPFLGILRKSWKLGFFETPKMAKTRIGGTNMWWSPPNYLLFRYPVWPPKTGFLGFLRKPLFWGDRQPGAHTVRGGVSHPVTLRIRGVYTVHRHRIWFRDVAHSGICTYMNTYTYSTSLGTAEKIAICHICIFRSQARRVSESFVVAWAVPHARCSMNALNVDSVTNIHFAFPETM